MQVAKLEQEAQRQKSMPSAQSHLERRAVRGGGGNHHAQEVRCASAVHSLGQEVLFNALCVGVSFDETWTS